MSSTGSGLSGQGSVVAAQMAIDDYTQQTGRKVELVSADSQAKPDVAATIARRWFDQEGVDVIADLPPSSVALAVQTLAKERGRILLFGAAGSLELVGRQCSETSFQWAYNSVAVSRALARPSSRMAARRGCRGQDIAYGQSLEEQVRIVVKRMAARSSASRGCRRI